MLRLLTGSTLIRGLGAASQLGLTLLIAHMLSRGAAGEYFFAFSLLVILATLSRMGSELSALRIGSLHSDAGYEHSGSVSTVRAEVEARLLVAAAVSCIVAVALLAAAPLVAHATYGDGFIWTLRWTAVAIPPMALVVVLSASLIALGRALIGLIVQSLAIPAVTMPALLMVRVLGYELDAGTSAAATALVTWIVAAIGLLWVRQAIALTGPVDAPRAGKAMIRTVLRDAPSLLLISMTVVIMQWIGSAMLGFMVPPSGVAGFNVANRISVVASIVNSAAANVVSPQIARAYGERDLTRVELLCWRTCLFVGGLTVPFLVAGIVFAGPCMSLFGSGYSGSASLLQILTVGQIVLAVFGHSGMVLVMAGRYRQARVCVVIPMVALAALGGVLIPTMGVTGAALADTVAVGLGQLAAVILVRTELGLYTFPTSLIGLRKAVA